MTITRAVCITLLEASLFIAAAPARGDEDLSTLRYIGSSTVGNFIQDAEAAYGRARFLIDTEPESVGGERAIVEGIADFAGIAAPPRPETLAKGVVATLIGRDAIAVIVHPGNPVAGLSLEQLRGLFTGGIRNWKEIGGADLDVHPIIVAPESATRQVFRSAVLGAADYVDCETVEPATEVIERVANDPGAVGQISFSFLGECGRARPVPVEGEEPRTENSTYPITRPLYLLWWPGRSSVAAFVSWAQSEEGQKVVMRKFLGVRSLRDAGSAGGSER